MKRPTVASPSMNSQRNASSTVSVAIVVSPRWNTPARQTLGVQLRRLGQVHERAAVNITDQRCTSPAERVTSPLVALRILNRSDGRLQGQGIAIPSCFKARPRTAPPWRDVSAISLRAYPRPNAPRLLHAAVGLTAVTIDRV